MRRARRIWAPRSLMPQATERQSARRTTARVSRDRAMLARTPSRASARSRHRTTTSRAASTRIAGWSFRATIAPPPLVDALIRPSTWRLVSGSTPPFPRHRSDPARSAVPASADSLHRAVVKAHAIATASRINPSPTESDHDRRRLFAAGAVGVALATTDCGPTLPTRPDVAYASTDGSPTVVATFSILAHSGVVHAARL